jgi:hypothetical protein
MLLAIMANATDFGIYVYAAMEVNTAAQAAAQAIYVTCGATGDVPATTGTNCPTYSTAETTAAHRTSLGTRVTVSSTTENYYCVNSSGTLQALTGTFPNNSASSCTSVWSTNTATPGDYVLVSVSYAYTPLYSGISLTSLLPRPIRRTIYMRVG